MKNEKKDNGEKFKNVAQGLKIVLNIVLFFVGIAVLAILIFVAIRLWQGITKELGISEGNAAVTELCDGSSLSLPGGYETLWITA